MTIIKEFYAPNSASLIVELIFLRSVYLYSYSLTWRPRCYFFIFLSLFIAHVRHLHKFGACIYRTWIPDDFSFIISSQSSLHNHRWLLISYHFIINVHILCIEHKIYTVCVVSDVVSQRKTERCQLGAWRDIVFFIFIALPRLASHNSNEIKKIDDKWL